jgi:hypothetical protein
VALKRAVRDTSCQQEGLAAKAIQGTALSLEGVDHVHGCNRLALGVLAVGNRVANDVFQEELQDATHFLINEARNAFDTASTSQSTNGWFRDALDVIAEHFAMALRTTLSQTFATFSTARHVVVTVVAGVLSKE